MSFSIVIIAKNEEEQIARTLEAIKDISDDIVVADTGSTDRTIEIAKSYKVRVERLEWKGYGPTKNEANSLAKCDWILSLDADEEVNSELAEDICTKLKHSPSPQTIFSLKRRLVFLGKVMEHGSVSDEWRNRFFNRQHWQWNENLVHEELIPIYKSKRLKKIKLNGHVFHHSYKDKKDLKVRLKKYASLSAEEKKAAGQQISSSKGMVHSSWSFFKNYVIRRGFLDGRAGFIHAKENAAYVKEKYRKARKKS